MAYFVNQWTALTRFLEDGRLSLGNNRCEQQRRSIALGRKKFLFSGSHAAAERAGILYSLMRTCVQYDVDPLAYLADVLRKLAAGTYTNRLDELLPIRWPPPTRELTPLEAPATYRSLPRLGRPDLGRPDVYTTSACWNGPGIYPGF